MQKVTVEIKNGIATVIDLPDGIEVVIIDKDNQQADDVSRFVYRKESGEIVLVDFGLLPPVDDAYETLHEHMYEGV